MALTGCQIQAIRSLANALQYGEGSDVAILKLAWALKSYIFGGKEDLVTNCVGYIAVVAIGITFLLGLSLQ